MSETEKLQLKVEALLQTNTALTNQIADIRVEITVLATELQEAKAKIQELETDAPSEPGTTE